MHFFFGYPLEDNYRTDLIPYISE